MVLKQLFGAYKETLSDDRRVQKNVRAQAWRTPQSSSAEDRDRTDRQ